MHFCAWFFAAVVLCSVFFFLQDLMTAEDEERTPGSGAAQGRVWLEGLLASSTGGVGLFWRLFCALFS